MERIHKNMFYYIQIITWIICRLIFKVFLRLKINGRDKIESLDKGGVVFVANHASKLDAFIIGCSLPFGYFKKMARLRYMTDKKYTENKFYGSALKILGAYTIYNAGGDYEKSLNETIDYLKNNQSVVIFPTGKIEENFDATNARPGVAYLAKKLNPVLIPVYISNTKKLRPFEFFIFLRESEVTFGKPFLLKDLTSNEDDLRGNAKMMMERVLSLGN
jgi:1-acyl-sn-glycerol-3-phosphate acyltransferase